MSINLHKAKENLNIEAFFGVSARSVKVLYNIYMTVLLPIRQEKTGKGWSW